MKPDRVKYDGGVNDAAIDARLRELSNRIDSADTSTQERQKNKDLWLGLKWLRSLPRGRRIVTELWQGESPDFIVRTPEEEFGLEVTEASNDEEREHDAHRSGSWFGPYSGDAASGEKIALGIEWVMRSLRKKVKKLERYNREIAVCDLLIYFNSMQIMAPDEEEFIRALRPEVEKAKSGFRNVFLLDDRIEQLAGSLS